MRLWHQYLIPYLDNQRLLGQHRECCALRGNGWNRRHSTVDYVFMHPYSWLFMYHLEVMNEMEHRNFHVDYSWNILNYRGKTLYYADPSSAFMKQGFDDQLKSYMRALKFGQIDHLPIIYAKEHDDQYLNKCLDILMNKGAQLINTSIQKEKLKLAIEKGL